jgi:hypothetical protein
MSPSGWRRPARSSSENKQSGVRFRGTCDNYLFGLSKPFDLTKNTGGSSGAAGAVAAGSLALGEGTDGGVHSHPALVRRL